MMADTAHGNNLILNGSYQQHDGHASYIFVQNNLSVFEVFSSVLDVIEILQAQFVTVIPPDGLNPDGTVHTKFILNGRLRFEAIPYFDCFSFGNTYNFQKFKLKTNNTKANTKVADGYLNFSNLVISMDFPQEKPTDKVFRFDASNLSFDMSLSVARAESFYSHFPLNLTGMLQQQGTQKPGDLGFMSVVSPLNQGSLQSNWYGFTYTLSLGSLGSLASDTGFSIVLFIGWQPTSNETQSNIYIGVSLPGSSTGNNKIPIEGLLNLVFRKIEITANEILIPEGTPGMSYMLKFRGISLSLFSFSFPPGLLDAYIFGNPGSKRTALGWYAAYAKEEKEDDKRDGTKTQFKTPQIS